MMAAMASVLLMCVKERRDQTEKSLATSEISGARDPTAASRGSAFMKH